MIALFALAAVGFSVGLVSYLRYAAEWLRQPPRMSQCVLISRRLLSREEPVTGSIPHMTAEGATVYLRKAEDRAVSCVGRMSSSVASRLAGAFAETEPVPRARALLAVVRDHISKDPSADREALAVNLIASSAVRALPEQPETNAARDELDQLRACRFALHTECATRPPVPIIVWAAGVPSSVVLVTGIGWGGGLLLKRARAWWRNRKKKA